MVEFILYVTDQKRSRDFYAKLLGKEPALDVNGMTEFMLTDECKLGLMPNAGIRKILRDAVPDPETGTGIPRCELYLYVEDIAASYSNAVNAGALEVSPVQLRSWGEKAAYVSDPDGHIIAFASV
jgi:uncharacterized glyoxalase superfamily protein PhnB